MYELYTDGSCKGNPGSGGWGFAFYKDGVLIDRQWGHLEETTNNRAELTAAVEGILLALEAVPPHMTLIVRTDSMYVVKGITEWVHRWLKSDWTTRTKEPVKNRDLWERLISFKEGRNIQFEWVRGHNNDPRNEYVDLLANRGAQNE